MSERFRPTWAVVDLEAVRRNVEELRPEGAALMAVVKANAYGHGDLAVARAALDAGAASLAVATLEEALRLREGGIEDPIMVLAELPAGSEAIAIAHRITPVICSGAGLARLAEAARGAAIGVHVKVDTGMHRLGVWPPEDAAGFCRRVADAGLDLEGLWTHLASSEEDDDLTALQLQRFSAAVDAVRGAGMEPRVLHAANSGGVLRHPGSVFDVVRPGIGIYGVAPGPDVAEAARLRPALAWRSEVVFVKRLAAGERLSYGQRYELDRGSWVATVPVGYADGYPRAASSRADVLLRGRRCRVAGNVTMDQLMVDCGDMEPDTGDEVVLIGEQGDDAISAWDLARWADTIAYEVLVGIGERVPRVYR